MDRWADVSDEEWRATDAALDRALDLEAEPRRAFLAALPEDRRQRVEGLLAAADGDGPLDRAVGDVAGRLMEAADEMLAPAAAGRPIGRWRLLERLGSGGMGVVYRAERSDDHYRHHAALKVIRWELADPALVQRFLDERQILAQLSHPNIATLLDGGVTDDGLPYLVMELIEGRPLDRFCAEEGLPHEARIRLVVAICRAVDEAHRQLVVHRDLKPSNILVRADGVPKLVDFGVAKLLDDSAARDATRVAPMTPLYAAPEQLRGGPITVAADVWALGLVLAEVIAGVPAADLGDREGMAESVRRRPELRGDLGTIVSHALDPDPRRRYRSAGALADDLERFLQGRPVSVRRPTLRYRLTRFVGRHRIAAVAIVVAHIAAGLGLGGIVWQARETRRERDLARQQALRAEQVTAFLRELFASAVPRIGGEPRVRELLDEGADRIESGMAGAPLARAELLETLGSAYKWLNEHERAEALVAEAVALQEELAAGSRDHAVAVASLGGVALSRGDHEAARAHFQRALDLLDDSPDATDHDRATILNSLGMADSALGDLETALVSLRESATLFAGLGDPAEASARGNLGLVLDKLGRHGEAEAEHRSSRDLYLREDPENASIATVTTNLAVNLSSQGRLDEAVEEIQRAREIWRTVPGSESALAATEANLAYVLIVAGRAEQAVGLAASAVRTLEAEDPDATNTVATKANLGWALVLAGRVDEAVPILEGVVVALAQRFGWNHAVTARGRTRYGAALHRADRLDEADGQLRRAVAAVDPERSSPVTVGDLMVSWGAVCCDTGRVDMGLEALDVARTAYSGAHGDRAWQTAWARLEAARCAAAADRAWDQRQVAEDLELVIAARGPESWEALRGAFAPSP
jgi:tetratricopeptide (TPR) repeat protein/tRNA A-37 threonylcarbamoyl transferase component Bud32